MPKPKKTWYGTLLADRAPVVERRGSGWVVLVPVVFPEEPGRLMYVEFPASRVKIWVTRLARAVMDATGRDKIAGLSDALPDAGASSN